MSVPVHNLAVLFVDVCGPLRVKIGFHGVVFGSTVNLAARVLARSDRVRF